MLARLAIVAAGMLAAGPSLADQLTTEAARHFIAGKLFAFNCFDGTRGAGRIATDGSVAGNVQFRGTGAIRFVALPPGTLKVKGQAYCAAMQGMPVEPCFNVNRTDAQSFRGSISGLGFAYCDFTRRNYRTMVRTSLRGPLPLQAVANASSE